MSVFSEIEKLLGDAVTHLAGKDSKIRPISIKGQLQEGRGKGRGDFSSAIAMALAAASDGLKSRDIALELATHMRTHCPEWLADIQVAGPGFLNFFLAQKTAADHLLQVLQKAEDFGRSPACGERILLEFVSSNPTGPLHIGHGRGAVVGAALAELYRASGFEVTCEYYVNDRGRQSHILALSAWLRMLGIEPPEGAYRGGYIGQLIEDEPAPKTDVKAQLLQQIAEHPDPEKRLDALIATMRRTLEDDALLALCNRLQERVLKTVRRDLGQLGVHFDSWFYESGLYSSDKQTDTPVQMAVERLLENGSAERRSDGAVWFLSQRYGDDKDRVLVRDNGEPTYFGSDVAYHMDKFARGYDRLVNVWGADHHGYEARLRGALKALGEDESRLSILYVQFVSLLKDGQRIGMSTRAGSFESLASLCEQVPADAVRLMYLQCAAEQPLDFDLQAAVARSRDNPAFYIQYAHARICSMEKKLSGMSSETIGPGPNILSLLEGDRETRLRQEIARFPSVVEQAAKRDEPHRMTTYLRDLAALFHSWYNAERILVDDPELRTARVTLSRALRQIFANGLGLLGLDAPESM